MAQEGDGVTSDRRSSLAAGAAGSPATDTSAELERLLADGYRRMTPAQKWHLICEQVAADDEHALAGLRLRHPGADERELRLRLAALAYGAEFVAAAFGWDPASEAR